MKLPFKSVLAKNTLWLAVGQGMRLLVQAAYFTVIARSLGSTNYGAFVGVSAIVGIAYPLASLGSGNMMIKDVARDQGTFRLSWGAALLRTLVFGSVLIAVIVLCSKFALPSNIPLRLVFLVAVADIIGLNWILLSAFAFQAFERMQWTSTIYLAISASRLLAALVLVRFHPHPSALAWAYAYVASTAAVALLAGISAARWLAPPKFKLRMTVQNLREGFFFAAGLSAQTIYNDLDKTMLARLGTLEATGIYGAAYRLIEVGFAPILALLNAAYPNFFRVGLQGIRASISYAKPLLGWSVLFSTGIAGLLALVAGYIPAILGQQFAASTEALRWLVLILPLRSIHSFLADIVTSANRQGLRTAVQVLVAVLNGLMNLWAIPAYSWRGAAFTSIVSDLLLVFGMFCVVWKLERSARLKPLERGQGKPAVEVIA